MISIPCEHTPEGFPVDRIAEDVLFLDDGKGDSVYLITGGARALCIDTGVSRTPLMPVLRRYTDKPIDLVLTHAHIDHMYACREFERIYMHEADIQAWRPTLKKLFGMGTRMYKVPNVPVPADRFLPLHEGDTVGPNLRVIHAPGHTPGSIILADEAHRLLFTGDAFGSGSAAWLWLPGCSSTSAYRDMLRELKQKLRCYEGFTLCGGHRLQAVTDPHGHEPTLDDIDSMIELTECMIRGTADRKRVHILGPIPLYLYTHENAGLVQRSNRARR